MAGVKFVVIYPRPTDIDAFEKLYQVEHVPMAVEKLVGKTRMMNLSVTKQRTIVKIGSAL